MHAYVCSGELRFDEIKQRQCSALCLHMGIYRHSFCFSLIKHQLQSHTVGRARPSWLLRWVKDLKLDVSALHPVGLNIYHTGSRLFVFNPLPSLPSTGAGHWSPPPPKTLLFLSLVRGTTLSFHSQTQHHAGREFLWSPQSSYLTELLDGLPPPRVNDLT